MVTIAGTGVGREEKRVVMRLNRIVRPHSGAGDAPMHARRIGVRVFPTSGAAL